MPKPTLPKLFIKQVALHKHPRKALNATRGTLGALDPAPLFDGLSKYAVFLRAIAPEPEPRSFANLWTQRRLSPRGLIADLQWNSETVRIHHRIINDFVATERVFENAYLIGDWEKCQTILDELETRNGLSLWLISRRITVNRKSGSITEEDYASKLISSADNGTVISWLVYMMSFRDDPNVTPATYIRTINDSLQSTDLPEGIVCFLKYHALNLPPRTADESSLIISASETSPIIDRYVALLDALQLIACTFADGTVERLTTAKCIRRLLDVIADDRLALLDEANSPDKLESLVRRVKCDEADSYTSGDYEGTITQISQALHGDPGKTSLYNLMARATLRSDINPYLPDRLSDIIRAMAAIQVFSQDNDPSVTEIYREGISGAHRSLSASIRCLVSGLGEDPSTSTLDASLEALNSATLTPLQLRNLPFGDRRRLLTKAQEAFPTSISLELQSAVLDFGTCEFPQSLRKRLPADRGDLYTARALVRIARLSEAAELLRKLETAPVTSVANDARRELYRAFVAAEKHCDALRLVARAYRQNNRLHAIFELEPLLDAIEQSSEGPPFGEIGLSICYHVLNRFNGDKRIGAQADAAEEFVFSRNSDLPSRLNLSILKEDSDLIPLFLDNVCIPAVLDKFMAIENVNQVEVERLGICRILSEIDQNNRQQYLDEIRDITRRRVVRERFEQVERTKIYVDIDGIKRQAEKTLKDSYQRFSAAQADEANASERLEMVRRVQELLADVRTDGVKIHFQDLPANEGEQIFDRLVKELIGLLVSSQQYGLEAYLSTRVRHGTMGNQLRSAFELQSILTQRDNGQYQPGNQWAENLGLGMPYGGSWLAQRLAKFSEDLDNLIEDLVRRRVQVRSDLNPDGLFIFHAFNYDFLRLQAEITSETSFDTFMDKVIEQFWIVLEFTLVRVRKYIEGDFIAAVYALTDELEKDIVREVSFANTSPLRDAIAAARTQMSVNVANVANWFTLARDMERPDYEFGIAVEVATESIRVCHPSLDVTLDRPDELSFDCRGKTLESLVYMLFTALDNALKHCGFNDHAPALSLETSLNGNWLELKLVNSCAPIDSLKKENDRLTALRLDLESADEAQGLATIEGGSGYAKIIRILRHDLLTRHALTFGYRSTTEYEVTIGMDAKVMVK